MWLDSINQDDDLPVVDESAQVSQFIRTFFPNNLWASESIAHVEIEYKYFPPNVGIAIERLGQSAEKVQGRTLMRAFKFWPHNNPWLIPQCIDMVRLRDEWGDGVKVAVKKCTNHHAVEQEFDTPEKLDDLVWRFTDNWMTPYSEMEKYRTTWKFDTCTIVLDECPGLEPFFEIEGPTEAAVEEAWSALWGFGIWWEKKKMSWTEVYEVNFWKGVLKAQKEVTFRTEFFVWTSH